MAELERYHVAPGSYYVGKIEPKILQAFLGTCVGVAVYDSDNGIGGISHLLLPEPILSDSSFMPEKYASNGLPLFINAFYETGASTEKLKASIAGGALIGPLNEMDLSLNIGGAQQK